MRFERRCEVEGCSEKSTQIVIDWDLFWAAWLCDAHKDEKLLTTPNCTNMPIVEPPPAE